MLTQQHIDIVKSTVPLLESAGPAITEHFYKRMFNENPDLQHIFNMGNQHSGRQAFALFSAIAAYAKHLDTPEQLLGMVERIAHKHTSLNIQPEHYAIVGHNLIETLRELVPEQFTPDVEDAWGTAYGVLAGIFIDREGALYHQRAQEKGGWQGGRQFRLTEKRIESELVKSLVFEPVDGGTVIDYQPGQYIGIEVLPKGSDYREIRQYSLSDACRGDSYRISVKREIVGRPGVVSNYLHDGLRLGDEVTLYPPAGDFFLQQNNDPVVLVSAGVGLTPMQAMLETLLKAESAQSITYLHACENSEQHSFKKRNQALASAANVECYTWYKAEQSEADNTFHGYMDLSLLADTLPLAQGHYYLCGPLSFMQFAKQQLQTLGVDGERIHYEVFGPHEDV